MQNFFLRESETGIIYWVVNEDYLVFYYFFIYQYKYGIIIGNKIQEYGMDVSHLLDELGIRGGHNCQQVAQICLIQVWNKQLIELMDGFPQKFGRFCHQTHKNVNQYMDGFLGIVLGLLFIFFYFLFGFRLLCFMQLLEIFLHHVELLAGLELFWVDQGEEQQTDIEIIETYFRRNKFTINFLVFDYFLLQPKHTFLNLPFGLLILNLSNSLPLNLHQQIQQPHMHLPRHILLLLGCGLKQMIEDIGQYKQIMLRVRNWILFGVSCVMVEIQEQSYGGQNLGV